MEEGFIIIIAGSPLAIWDVYYKSKKLCLYQLLVATELLWFLKMTVNHLIYFSKVTRRTQSYSCCATELESSPTFGANPKKHSLQYECATK